MRARRFLLLFSILALVTVTPGFYSRPPASSTPWSTESRTAGHGGAGASGLSDIIDTLRTSSDCTIFQTALASTDVDATLRGRGPLTVFAPTDEAFGKLPRDQFDRYMQDTAELRRLVEGHIIKGNLSRSEVRKGTVATTLLGSQLSIQRGDRGVVVDNVGQQQRKFIASNGVIYSIDTVLVPAR